MEQILTIAIPTFNHHSELKKQLNVLLPQITNEVELIIIDNNSTPPITSVLFEDDINIIKNEENIGGDANIFKCFKICKTKWLWVLSDNDLINNNAVKTILTEIKNNNQAIFINFGNVKNIVTKDYSEFFRNANYINSFTISNCIYNISELGISFPIYKACINTHQAQLLFLIKHLEKYNKNCILSSTNIIDNSLLAQWPKYAFIKDSLNIYRFIKKDNLQLFRKTLGKQVIRMHLFLLIEAYSIDGLSLKNYISVFILIIKKSKITQFLSKGFVKLLIFYVFFLFFPKLYLSFYAKRKGDNHNPIADNSNWNC